MQVIRIFHVIHCNGLVYNLYNKATSQTSLFTIDCEDDDNIRLQITSVVALCGLSAGLLKFVQADTYVDSQGRAIELWVLYADARNSTRNRNTGDTVQGTWTRPEDLECRADEATSEWIKRLQAKSVWNNDDIIQTYLNEGNLKL